MSLRSGHPGKALDMNGDEYGKASFEFYQKALPAGDREFRHLDLTLSHQIQLLLSTSNQANRFRMRAVFAAAQNSFRKTAEDFGLVDAIQRFLIAGGHVDRRKYRVGDLRRFPDYARIIGYRDDRRFSPKKIIPCNRPRGWVTDYYLVESPVLPPDAEMMTRPNAAYIIDDEHPIPQVLAHIVEQALYWQITEFRWNFLHPPQRG